MEVSVQPPLRWRSSSLVTCLHLDAVVSNIGGEQIPKKYSLLRRGKPKEIWGRKATGQASDSTVLASRPGCRSDSARLL